MTTAALRDILEWDVRNWAAALQFWSGHTRLDLPACTALELGSRHGGLSLWLATLGASVVCSDLEGPTGRARRKHAVAGVAPSIRYECVDATRIPYADHFDLVVFKSVLGAVGREGGRQAQARAVTQMYKALKPGGELFFAENLVASPMHRFLRRRFVGWSTSWRYVSIEEMRDFLRPFACVSYRTIGFAGAFGRTGRQRAILGTLDRALLDGMVPESWRYVIAGVARK